METEPANKISYKITRKTSKYNKYMKWQLELFRKDNTRLSSQYFKTQKAAMESIKRAIYRGQKGFPIGNRLSYTDYIQL